MSPALSANHDDHHGRVARGRTVDVKHGRWIGTSTPLGLYDCGRALAEPMADAVHDTGRVSVHGMVDQRATKEGCPGVNGTATVWCERARKGRLEQRVSQVIQRYEAEVCPPRSLNN